MLIIRPIIDFYLRGDNLGLSWDKGIQMDKSGSDLWTITLHFTTMIEKLEFKTLVDDNEWQIGANEFVLFKTHEEKVIVDVYPWYYTHEGTLDVIHDVHSPELENNRNIITYLPPSFNENKKKKYKNVIIMHDGNNLFDPKTAYQHPWWCQNTANEMINKGDLSEVVLVGLWNTPGRMDEYTYSYDPEYKSGGKGDKYLDFIENEVFDLIEKNYRAVIQRETLGILGSSLGGIISCYAGWSRSDVYSRVGCMSSSFFWNSEDFDTVIMEGEEPQQPIVFYLDTGDVKDNYNVTVTVKDHFLRLKDFVLNENLFYYLDRGATHNEDCWGARFHVPLADMYPLDVHEV